MISIGPTIWSSAWGSPNTATRVPPSFTLALFPVLNDVPSGGSVKSAIRVTLYSGGKAVGKLYMHQSGRYKSNAAFDGVQIEGTAGHSFGCMLGSEKNEDIPSILPADKSSNPYHGSVSLVDFAGNDLAYGGVLNVTGTMTSNPIVRLLGTYSYRAECGAPVLITAPANDATRRRVEIANLGPDPIYIGASPSMGLDAFPIPAGGFATLETNSPLYADTDSVLQVAPADTRVAEFGV